VSEAVGVKFSFAIVLIGVTLAGCGLTGQQELQARKDELNAQSKAAMESCNETHPGGNPKTAVARAKCQTEAMAIRLPIMTYPDLLRSFIATRMVVAEQVQDGKLTIAQGNEIVANKLSEMVTEEQRRNLANRSVRAQEGIAAASLASAGPHTCTSFGNTVNCF
jgi:hypothetical protein